VYGRNLTVCGTALLYSSGSVRGIVPALNPLIYLYYSLLFIINGTVEHTYKGKKERKKKKVKERGNYTRMGFQRSGVPQSAH
jgi:hypothetical protein